MIAIRIIKSGWRHNGVLQPIGTEMSFPDKLALRMIDQAYAVRVGTGTGAALLTKGPVTSSRPLRKGCCGGGW